MFLNFAKSSLKIDEAYHDNLSKFKNFLCSRARTGDSAFKVNITRANPLTELNNKSIIFNSAISTLYKKGNNFYHALYFDKNKKRLNQVLKASISNKNLSIYFHDKKVQTIYNLTEQVIFQWMAIANKTILTHSSSFNIGGQGFIAFGESGFGKTTLLKNLMKHASKDIILNDENNYIYQEKSCYKLSPSPWHGELSIVNNKTVPLDYLFYIDKSKHGKNLIKPISPEAAFLRTVHTSFLPFWDSGLLSCCLARIEKMVCENKNRLFAFSYDKNSNLYVFLKEFILKDQSDKNYKPDKSIQQ